MMRLPLIGIATAALALPVGSAEAREGAATDAGDARGKASRDGVLSPGRGGQLLRIRTGSGLVAKRTRYVLRRQLVTVEATVRPYRAERRQAVMRVLRSSKRVRMFRKPVKQKGSTGRVRFQFRPGRKGSYLVRVGVGGRWGSVSELEFKSLSSHGSGLGARGLRVRLLQRGLRKLGYPAPLSGRLDTATARAVRAFRQVNGLGRAGRATRGVYARVFRKRGAFEPRRTRAGKHVEFDWSRQVLALVRNGRARRTYYVSSGTPATPTVYGTYRFYRKEPGYNALGMLHSNYFVGGYAIHGYKSVPTYPASHGCIRVPIPQAREIDRWISFGDPLVSYR